MRFVENHPDRPRLRVGFGLVRLCVGDKMQMGSCTIDVGCFNLSMYDAKSVPERSKNSATVAWLDPTDRDLSGGVIKG